jgi:hypothetical protein
MNSPNQTVTPAASPLAARSLQLRALWQTLPGFVCAFVPRRAAAAG